MDEERTNVVSNTLDKKVKVPIFGLIRAREGRKPLTGAKLTIPPRKSLEDISEDIANE